MKRRPHILWADDEIDLLKPHILFLEGKGYDVTGVPDGASAIELLDEEVVDLVLRGWKHCRKSRLGGHICPA
jgi:DNA-binding response OmpR family regulator